MSRVREPSARGEGGGAGGPAERVELAWRRVIAAVALHGEQATHRAGLSVTESLLVHLLALQGPRTPSQLARLSGLPSGTVSGLLDRLAQLSLVRREPHASDRRKVVVVLDDDQAAGRLGPVEEAARLDAVVARFTPGEQATIAEFLIAAVAAMPGP